MKIVTSKHQNPIFTYTSWKGDSKVYSFIYWIMLLNNHMHLKSNEALIEVMDKNRYIASKETWVAM
jgi:hypothetical protein